ncbi:MAG TPA: WD40 repeat domain-containing protein [Anaerolineales bacterium]|nr:WD40 repeat domain-containing protein [Anaerolineales bacterium]
MKQHKWIQLVLGLLLTALVLDACTFSVEIVSTPSVQVTSTFLPTGTMSPDFLTINAPSPTATEFALPASSATPTLISIRADTTPMLEIVWNVQAGEMIRTLAFTPDGTVLASAGGNSSDFVIRLWDVVNNQLLTTLDGHAGIIWSMAFSPDGSLLASVSSDQTAKIWDWRNGLLVKTLEFPGEVVSVSFSPDGQSLAVGGVDEIKNQVQHAAVWTYSVGSWQPLIKFPEYIDVAALAYSPRGGTLIGGGTSRNVQVWRANDGKQVYTLNHAHQVSKAAISPDGSTVATATCITVVNAECSEGGVWLWDLPSGKLIRKLRGFPNVVENVAFSADGSSLLAASRDGTMHFYTTSNYDGQTFDFNSPGGNSALAVSPDGGFLATGNNSGAVYLWKIVYHP